MPTCAHIWEGGKKERAGIFLEGLGGAELALVAQAAGKGASVMLKLVIALLQTTGHKLSPLCESATACPVCLVCCCSPETRALHSQSLPSHCSSHLLVPEALAAAETIQKVPNSIQLCFAGLLFMQSGCPEGC